MCPSTCFSRTNCSLSRYNAKGKLNCFNCKTGVFLRLFTLMFTNGSNYNSRFGEKINSSMGNINNNKKKLSVPRVQTAALIES